MRSFEQACVARCEAEAGPPSRMWEMLWPKCISLLVRLVGQWSILWFVPHSPRLSRLLRRKQRLPISSRGGSDSRSCLCRFNSTRPRTICKWTAAQGKRDASGGGGLKTRLAALWIHWLALSDSYLFAMDFRGVEYVPVDCLQAIFSYLSVEYVVRYKFSHSSSIP